MLKDVAKNKKTKRNDPRRFDANITLARVQEEEKRNDSLAENH